MTPAQARFLALLSERGPQIGYAKTMRACWRAGWTEAAYGGRDRITPQGQLALEKWNAQ